jgi:4-amino-4-deoxy-L-arabinose transferase-like glycosyltransferase
MSFTDFFKENSQQLSLVLIILLFVSFAVVGITDSSHVDTDASRHAMDGLYYLDLFSGIFTGKISLSPAAIYEFTTNYFLHYPALGLLFWPPLFPLVEALFFFIFGVSAVSAKLTVIFFGVIALIFWHKIVLLEFRKFKSRKEMAFFSTLLLSLLPFFILFSRRVMREIPALSVFLISSYFFLRWVHLKEKQKKYLLLSALFLSLSILIKPETVFFSLAFIPVFIFSEQNSLTPKNICNLLFRKEMFFAVLIVLLVLIPWIIFTFEFHPERLGESFGNLGNSSRLSIDNWLFYLKALPERVGWAGFVLSCAAFFYFLFSSSAAVSLRGALTYARKAVAGDDPYGEAGHSTARSTRRASRGAAFRKHFFFNRRAEPVFFVSFFIVAYVFLSIVSWKDLRFTFYMIPVFSILPFFWFFSSSFFNRPVIRLKKFVLRLSTLVSILLVCAAFINALYVREDSFEGVSDAAKYSMLNSPPGSSLFFLSTYNGDFVYNVRLLDPDMSRIVLSGSIFLTSVRIYTRWGAQDIISSEQEIYRFFDEMGVYYVVVEEPCAFPDPLNNNKPYPPFVILDNMLHSANFTKEKTFTITGNQNLIVYKYNNYKKLSKDTITMPLFAIGRNVTVSLKKDYV